MVWGLPALMNRWRAPSWATARSNSAERNSDAFSVMTLSSRPPPGGQVGDHPPPATSGHTRRYSDATQNDSFGEPGLLNRTGVRVGATRFPLAREVEGIQGLRPRHHRLIGPLWGDNTKGARRSPQEEAPDSGLLVTTRAVGSWHPSAHRAGLVRTLNHVPKARIQHSSPCRRRCPRPPATASAWPNQFSVDHAPVRGHFGRHGQGDRLLLAQRRRPLPRGLKGPAHALLDLGP